MESGKKKNMMNSFIVDLWALILVRLPLKSITTSKLVCKQWKSIVESAFFRELFLSRHQDSHSSWSFMCRVPPEEVVAHYGCEVWGLQRPLGSYISSFLADKFKTKKDEHRPFSLPKEKVSVVAYTDVGLILITIKYFFRKPSYYVANPISRQCVEIPPLPLQPIVDFFMSSGLATRVVENGLVSGYKVVMVDTLNIEAGVLCLLVYSSETGLWSFNTLHSPLPLRHLVSSDPVSLNGNLYWLGRNLDNKEVVVSHDFYATGIESDRCRVILFPDLEKEVRNHRRVCTTSQGSLMYTNIVFEHRDDGFGEDISVWKLNTDEWQVFKVSEISPACMKFGFFPLAVNPFDANTMYMWNDMHECLVSTNLLKGKFRLHNNLERSSNGLTLSFVGESGIRRQKVSLNESHLSTFVLPRWLYQIPSPPS